MHGPLPEPHMRCDLRECFESGSGFRSLGNETILDDHMGLCIAVQTESGKQVELVADEKNLLNRLLDSQDATAFPMLASIDKYRDSFFSRMKWIASLLSGRRSSVAQSLLRKQQYWKRSGTSLRNRPKSFIDILYSLETKASTAVHSSKPGLRPGLRQSGHDLGHGPGRVPGKIKAG